MLTQTFKYSTDADASGEWTLKDESTTNERWQKNVRVTFKLSSSFYDKLGCSRVFAIASREDISKLLPSDASAAATQFSSLEKFQDYTCNFADIASNDLKDIYSTPYNDQSNPVQSTDNGLIVGADGTLTCSTVKLYHVAAKVDFTWEVPTSLQQTTELASITCTGLPTTCKVFEPTGNPTTATTNCLVLGSSSDSATPITEVNAGNKWLGRAYTYVLQPSSGTINYTVTYGGTSGKKETTAKFTPASVNNVFTGWYRIIATVVADVSNVGTARKQTECRDVENVTYYEMK